MKERLGVNRRRLLGKKGLTLVEAVIAGVATALVGYTILYSASAFFKFSEHNALSAQLIQTGQDILALRSVSRTLASVPYNGRTLACPFTDPSCVNGYTAADVMAACVDNIYVPPGGPTIPLPLQPNPLPFTLQLTDPNNNPMGKPIPASNLTQIGSFTYMTGCVAVPTPTGPKPCLVIQAAIPLQLNVASPYLSTFRPDPMDRHLLSWTPIYSVPDCGNRIDLVGPSSSITGSSTNFIPPTSSGT